jgi:hypothetical protein
MRSPYPSLIPPKLVQKGGIEEIPPRAPQTLELGKPQNRAPLLTDLGGESQPKEPRRVPTNFPHQIPKRKVPKKNPKKSPRGGSENHHQEQPGTTHPNLEKPRRIIYTCNKGSYKV